MVQQLAYISFSRNDLCQAALRDILESSTRNNAHNGITGMLMYHDRIFFQVLEGGSDAVQDCYDRISQDDRHGIISLICNRPAGKRSFSNWIMGYAGPDRIGQYTKQSFPGLASFINNEVKSETSSATAVTLAREMFREFEAQTYQNAPA